MTTVINKRPHLSAQTYWGFDNTILNDPKKFKKYAIVRAFERGTSQDINELFDFYGANVKITLLREKNLSPRALKTAEAIWPNFVEIRQGSSFSLICKPKASRLRKRLSFRTKSKHRTRGSAFL